jgi:hypothetical protein
MAGLKGVVIQTRSGTARRYLTGLKGITVGVNANLFIKVVDFSGRGLYGVNLNVVESNKDFNGDSNGNLASAVGATATLVFTKDKVKKTVNYTSAQGGRILVTLDVPLLQ